MGPWAGRTNFGRGTGSRSMVILAVGDGVGVCPDCGKQAERRHGWHERHLQDLPAQGAAVTVKLRIQRWQCQNKACKRQTFASQLPEIAAPLARRTARAAELVHLFGHGVGGRPGERLLKRIGMPTSDDTILRHLKRRARRTALERAFAWWVSTIGPGAKAPLMGPSWWTWSGGR